MFRATQCLFYLKILLLFRNINSTEVLEDYSYKSLLSGKYYRFLPSGRTADLDCVIPDIHCLPDESNVIDVFFGVRSAGDCQLSCVYHHSDCAVFTWFDSQHSTFPQSCFLYSRCDKAIQSEHSVTGPPSCVCGQKMACQGVHNNFVGFKENIAGEPECQTLCRDTETCEYYTWFDPTNKVFHNYCFLFSSCETVSCNCVGCSSGPPSCSAPVGEVLPSAAPAPALVTADNLSVPSSLLPPAAAAEPELGLNKVDTGLSSIQITDESGSKVLVNISAAAADSAAAAPGAQQLQLAGNSTQGLKSTILNYFPSLKWLFVFVD